MSWIGRSLAAAVFVAVALAVPAALFHAAGATKVEVPLDVIEAVDAGLSRLAAPAEHPDQHRVAFLGDSMVVGYRAGQTVPERLQTILDRGPVAGRFHVEAVAAPGMGPFDFYFIADRVAAVSPDQVILPVNLTAFSKSWRETFSRPQLAGFLPPRRLPQALSLPMDWIGLTADRVLGYFTVVQLGGAESWAELSRKQVRVGTARSSLSRRVGDRWGGGAEAQLAEETLRYFKERFRVAGGERLSAEALLERYEAVLRGVDPDDPTLRLLTATLEIFAQAGIDVLVYANPTNVEHIERVGASNPQALARSLAEIERTVTAAGARWIDLHDLVGDDGFRDGAGHLSIGTEGTDGALLLVRSLVPPLVQDARRRSARRASERGSD